MLHSSLTWGTPILQGSLSSQAGCGAVQLNHPSPTVSHLLPSLSFPVQQMGTGVGIGWMLCGLAEALD